MSSIPYIFIFAEYDGIYPIELNLDFIVCKQKLEKTSSSLSEIHKRNIKIMDIYDDNMKNDIKKIMKNDFVLIYESRDRLCFHSKYSFLLQCYKLCDKDIINYNKNIESTFYESTFYESTFYDIIKSYLSEQSITNQTIINYNDVKSISKKLGANYIPILIFPKHICYDFSVNFIRID
jgi:hypothetical protein